MFLRHQRIQLVENVTSQYKYEVIFKYTVRESHYYRKEWHPKKQHLFYKKKEIIRKQNTNTQRIGIKPLFRLIANQNREQNNQVQ